MRILIYYVETHSYLILQLCLWPPRRRRPSRRRSGRWVGQLLALCP